MMLRTKRERRAAPAAQPLSGLKNCLEMFFAKRCSRNIALLVEPLSNVSWKDSPRVAAIAPLVDLCRLYQIGTYSSCKLVDPPVKRARAKPSARILCRKTTLMRHPLALFHSLCQWAQMRSVNSCEQS